MSRASSAVLVAVFAIACSESGLGVSGPDAGGLVFVRERDGSADLARARLSDGAVVPITRTPEREERWPYWSPIARRIVFQARPYGPDLRTDLYLWDPVTGEETSVTGTPRRDERWPVWSPTESVLAYAFRQTGVSGIAILAVPSLQGELVARAGPNDFFFRPAFLPGGRFLVAQRRVRDGEGSHLYLLGPGLTPRALTNGDVFDTKPFPASDGQSVIFTRRAARGAPGDLARVSRSGGDAEIFASVPDADDHSAKQSPTRQEIVFVSDRDGSADIFLIDVSGGELRNLTRSPELDEAAPIWSPDGDRLVVLVTPRGAAHAEGGPPAAGARLLVLDRQGRRIFETPGLMADWMPAWP